MKGVSDGYAVHQLLVARAMVAVPLIFFWIRMSGEFQALKSQPAVKMVLRGIFLLVAFMFFYLSIVAMPLATATALFFTSPFFISILSVPILGESLGIRRIGGIILGFIGVIIVLNPRGEDFGIHSLLPVFSAFSYSCAQIMIRTMELDAKATVMAFYSNFVYFVAGVLMAIALSFVNMESENPSIQFLFRSWAMPNIQDALLIMGSGFATAWASVLSSQAYQLSEASKIATMEYSPIIWVVILGYLFLSEVPDMQTILGVAVIMAAGLYVIKREGIRTDKPLARAGLTR